MTTDPIPFRFKAGGNMATAIAHHHRNDTSKPNKSFKPKFASKGALKERAKGRLLERGVRKTPHQQVMSKIDRRHRAHQKRQAKHDEKVKATSIFSGASGAPRNVAVLSLTEDGDPRATIRKLNESVGADESVDDDLLHLHIGRFKQNIIYITVEGGLIHALDACRVADFVLLVLSAQVEVDEDVQMLLRSIEGQGISNVFAVVQGLDTTSNSNSKKRNAIVSSLKSFINHFFPTIEKVHSVDSIQDCANVMRSLCTATPKGVRWRDERSYMLVEEIKWSTPPPPTVPDGVAGAIFTGTIRGRGLKADRLVHIPEWGDFQIDSISAAPLSGSYRKGKEKKDVLSMVDQTADILDRPTEDQDVLETIAPEEVVMENEPTTSDLTDRKGVLLDDHHYFSDDEPEADSKPKRLPKGTSSYQSAWYLDDVSDSGSDIEEQDDDVQMSSTTDPDFPPAAATEILMDEDGPTEAGEPSEYPKSEAPFVDRSLDEEMADLETYRATRKAEEKDDLEFPDEIELHPNVLARERLSKYRGLKSLKTSIWNTDEDKPYEPSHWSQLLQIPDYKGSRNKAVHEALVGGVSPGTRVSVYLRNVPLSLQAHTKPISLFSLLRHEHKHTCCNINLTLSSTHPSPLKSKEHLILQSGPRRLLVNPVFSSTDTTPNNVHKFDRYLHPGRTAVASYVGPLTFGSIPSLVFKSTPGRLELIATGTTLPPSPSRVIAKRVILTGHPYKIHKKLVTVRYMFFNAADVAWFKALQLWTRRGRTGFIKESLGTHGYFKATFDGRINPMDAVAVSLYKRVWPRESQMWGGGVDATTPPSVT